MLNQRRSWRVVGTMKVKTFLLIGCLTGIVLHPSKSWAVPVFVDGNSLYQSCVSSMVADVADCLGYTSGIADVLGEGNPVNHYVACFPQNMQRGQISDVVIKFLREHPELRQLGAAGLVADALAEAFPCR